MKIGIVQTQSIKGDIPKNIEHHLHFIDIAQSHGADAIFFPELSITGYEPTLAQALAIAIDDNRFDVFQQLSDTNNIIVGIGAPVKAIEGVCISMLLFQPHQSRQMYSKKYLHADELPFFVSGTNTLEMIGDLALAICYEISVPLHVENVAHKGAKIYVASVAKSVSGMEKTFERLSYIAQTYQMTVLMSNCIGFCDDFESGGKSAIWNTHGQQVAQLNDYQEGMLIFDTKTQKALRILSPFYS
ncbi:MAG: carbon-nitrogen hydrolase family protein [Spirosomataceae bacterium]